MMKRSNYVVCIMGPTASGKSALGLTLAKQLGAEIVTVDSAQVYRGLDIGTAKPSRSERQGVPHHLLDIRDPSEPYSAGDFRQDALRAVTNIIARERVPLLVGGTMLYYRALQSGLADLPMANSALRKSIETQAEQIGWPALHQRLAEIDPQAAAKIQPNDAQRIQRAWEVYELTGKPISQLQRQTATLPYQFINIGLIPKEREQLKENIALRFQQMLDQGFVEEVKKLYARGDLSPQLPAIRAVGYRQLWEYLDGKVDFATACRQAITATRQLAKRQLTWLRTWPNLYRFNHIDQHLSDKVIQLLHEQAP